MITFASNQPIEFFLNVAREGKRIEKQVQAKNIELYHLYQASESSLRNSIGFFLLKLFFISCCAIDHIWGLELEQMPARIL